jgi:hypothetical protein
MAILNILQTFGIFYGHLVHFVFVWYIFSGLGIMYQEKSGNPASSSFFSLKLIAAKPPVFLHKNRHVDFWVRQFFVEA